MTTTLDVPGATWQQLDDYSFESVRTSLLDDGKDPAMVEASIRDLRRYFKLIALGYRDLGMTSPDVDDAWHALILDTREYAEFCERNFGRFIHHRPLRSSEPEESAKAAANFHAAYTEVFGGLPAATSNAKCDGGGGKCQSCQTD